MDDIDDALLINFSKREGGYRQKTISNNSLQY